MTTDRETVGEIERADSIFLRPGESAGMFAVGESAQVGVAHDPRRGAARRAAVPEAAEARSAGVPTLASLVPAGGAFLREPGTPPADGCDTPADANSLSNFLSLVARTRQPVTDAKQTDAACYGGGISGTGDVDGPANATDNALARFDGTSGKVIQNSGVVLLDDNHMIGSAAISMPQRADALPLVPGQGQFWVADESSGRPMFTDIAAVDHAIALRGEIDLATDVVGVLPIAKGGTGATSDDGAQESLIKNTTSRAVDLESMVPVWAATIARAGHTTLRAVFNALNHLPAKSALIDGDDLALLDSAASMHAKRISWANVKASLGALAVLNTIGTDRIDDNAVTNAKLRDSVARSIVGRSGATTGDPGDIVAANDHEVLRRSGLSIGFGAIDLTQSAAITGALPIANGGTGETTVDGAINGLANGATTRAPVLGDVVLFQDVGTGGGKTSLDRALALGRKVMDFRLTLSSGTPVPTSDVTSSTLYLTPFAGNLIALYHNSAWLLVESAEVSLALSGMTSNRPQDIFAYWTGSAVALERVQWTSDTARATSLTRQDGVWVKSGDATRRYVGTIRSTSSTQTTDNARQRLVWNAHNRVRRAMVRRDTTASWTYNTASWRYANNSATNRLEVVVGLQDDAIDVHSIGAVAHSNSDYGQSIGYDATSPQTDTIHSQGGLGSGAFARIPTVARLTHLPATGFHFYSWIERGSSAAGTPTAYGSGGSSSFPNQSGINAIWSC